MTAYLLVKEGHFKIVRSGNAIRISKRSFDEWLSRSTYDLERKYRYGIDHKRKKNYSIVYNYTDEKR